MYSNYPSRAASLKMPTYRMGGFCRLFLIVLVSLALSCKVSAQDFSDHYIAKANSFVQADFPYNGTVYQSDGFQTGTDFTKTYTSLTDIGYEGANGVQVAYSYARPGAIGYFIHGQTAPLPATNTGIAGEKDSTFVRAEASTIDVLQVPPGASGPVTIRFNLSVNVGPAWFSYSPRADSFGLPGNYNFRMGYDAQIHVRNLNSGETGDTTLVVQSDGGDFMTIFSPQPFTVPAKPGDRISVYTDGGVAADAEIKETFFEADLSHTVRTYADVLTPGVTLTSLSGHDYSSPLALDSLTFPSPVPGGTVLTATVTLNRITSSDVVVGLSSSDSAVVRVHRAVIIPAGSSSATFPINTFRSHVTKTVTITATLGTVVQTQNLTITGR